MEEYIHGWVEAVNSAGHAELAAGQVRLLVELKTIITNYGQPGKNITQSRDAIRADLHALGLRLDEHTRSVAVCLAYPVTAERDGDWRVNHLRQVERDALNTRRITKINVGQAYVYAYISEARRPACRLTTSLAYGIPDCTVIGWLGTIAMHRK